MDYGSVFQSARGYDEYLEQFGTPGHVSSWNDYRDRVDLTSEQVQLLQSFKRDINVLCMAGAWCGDCVKQCPIFDVFEKTSSVLQVRYVDRDENEELKRELTICGGARVPQVIFLSEDGQFVGRNGDRTLSRYRAMAEAQLGATVPAGANCPTGLVGDGGDPVLQGVIQDWLDEFERIHWILRLSPRLRQLHGD